jgi:hypothetical protein
MQEDFGEIQASFSLREIPMDKPAYVITFLKAKNQCQQTFKCRKFHLEKISINS